MLGPGIAQHSRCKGRVPEVVGSSSAVHSAKQGRRCAQCHAFSPWHTWQHLPWPGGLGGRPGRGEKRAPPASVAKMHCGTSLGLLGILGCFDFWTLCEAGPGVGTEARQRPRLQHTARSRPVSLKCLDEHAEPQICVEIPTHSTRSRISLPKTLQVCTPSLPLDSRSRASRKSCLTACRLSKWAPSETSLTPSNCAGETP